eukprot:CAMPEP_0119046074 /NCGR_PEP_ID=MMETSP1177-20130426/44207_1 /TAXON_ID=2985 /ORGANISM="Ochromonas sp, Strain CCMP1899" /LENGTH=213 /DNA_ID=CAMNT_0007018707 /DNA_START=29 /DNA_END=670 /DNA_ORIENTATION=+
MANVDAFKNDGDTALMTAVQGGNQPVVALLLANKANVNAANENGRKAIDYAKIDSIKALLQMYMEQKAPAAAKKPVAKKAAPKKAAAGKSPVEKAVKPKPPSSAKKSPAPEEAAKVKAVPSKKRQRDQTEVTTGSSVEAEIDDEHLEFFVEKILSMTGDPKRVSTLEFLVKWLGYDDSYNSIEPWANLRDVEVLHNYLLQQDLGRIVPKKFKN